jgi:hypothetical protein
MGNGSERTFQCSWVLVAAACYDMIFHTLSPESSITSFENSLGHSRKNGAGKENDEIPPSFPRAVTGSRLDRID